MKILLVALGLTVLAASAHDAVAQGAGQRGTQNPGPGTLVTDTLWSQALGASKAIVVYLPPSYARETTRRYPIVFYLHGAGGDETNWTRLAQLNAVMDSLVAAGRPEMIVAMPDGDPWSFYTTHNILLDFAGCRRVMLPDTASAATAARDCVAWSHYDDYIANDVVRHMDAKYRTQGTRESRGIAGLSMGGYGAMLLAMQYPRVFSAAASHSGVLSPLDFVIGKSFARPLPRNSADSARFERTRAGFAPRTRVIFGNDSAGWYARDPATIAARLKASGQPLPALFVDSGTEDIYTPQSRAFRDAMAALGAPLEYREWPGAHTWSYWRAHLPESLTWIGQRIGGSSARR